MGSFSPLADNGCIWLHKPLSPLLTKGCCALDLLFALSDFFGVERLNFLSLQRTSWQVMFPTQ